MKISRIHILIACTALLIGSSLNDQYTFVGEEEAIELIKNNQINFINLSYTDQYGNPMSDSLRQLLNQGKMIRHFYKNSDGVIDQVRLIEANDVNIFYDIRVGELRQNPFSDIRYAQIDCNSSERLLKRALDRDRAVRQGMLENIREIDQVNRDTIISILDKCEWPSTSEEIIAIWYVIQHAGADKMAYYYPKFKEMVKLDLLEARLMAKMEDRMLMYNGYPQLYGTQMTGEPPAFFEIRDIHNVNERRKSVGLVPIEQMAKNQGIDFDWSDYKKEEDD